jgi:hypothetical protein
MGRPLLRCVLLLSLGALQLTAQQHSTVFTGTWKMNPAKSRFTPGPPFRGFTITFTQDGRRNLDLVDAGGNKLHVELPWSDGKEVEVSGMENTTATSKILGRRTFHDVWKQNGKIIEDVHGAVSSKGRVLKITVDVTGLQGRHAHNELWFDKQ